MAKGWNKYQIQRRLISRNYTKGRVAIQGIVFHTPVGGGIKNDLFAWFNKSTTKASVHYSVGLDGTIYQYVRDKDTAWANSNSGINKRMLSIEFGDNGKPWDTKRTDKLYDAGGWLVARLIYKYKKKNRKVKFNSDIFLHKQFASKPCPAGLDYERLIRVANKYLSIWRKPKENNKVEEAEKAPTEDIVEDSTKPATIADIEVLERDISELTERIEKLEQ